MIKQLLSHLEGQDDIAGYLLAKGHRGFRKVACGCPVARFLIKESGESDLTVGALGVFWGNLNHAAVPPRVMDFVEAFDKGNHPELVMDHSEVGAYV